MLDGTYRENKLRMPLYVFIVEGGSGKGRVVGYSLVSDDRKSTLEDLVTTFGKIYDLTKVKTLVIEKDSIKISAIKKVVSNASLQICKFHVAQVFTCEIKKLPIGQEERQKVTQLLKQLIFAKSENMYAKVYGKFTEVAPQHLIDYLLITQQNCC